MNAPMIPTSAPAPSPQARGWPLENIVLGPDGERRWPHLLLVAVAAFFVLAVVWACVFTIDEVARGDGRVIPRQQVQVVTNLEGGIIQEVLVREGDLVEANQPLVRMDDTRFAAAYREGEQGTLALKAKIARLQAEAGRTALAMPKDVQAGSPVLAERERALYAAHQAEQATRAQVLRQQLAQRESELQELRNRAQRLAEQLVLVDKEVAITAPLVKRGVVAEVELLRLEREQARTRTDLEQARFGIPRAQAAIDEAKGKLADLDAAFRSQAGAELAQAQGELAKLAEQIPALEDRSSRTLVRAPVRGIVKTIPNKTLGGVVQPGSPMMEIVPAADTLLVEVRLKPADIAFVQIGQRAIVKPSAYDYSIFGGLEGRIEHVSADSIVPPQGEPYYVAHVATTRNAIEYHGKKLGISPGMLATVDIITGHRSVMHYLAKPINRARERAMTER